MTIKEYFMADGHYDAYLVCENGHGVNDSFYKNPEFNKKFCTNCGAKTFKDCPSCGSDIQGEYYLPGLVDLTGGITPVPDICKDCGNNFPWKTRKTVAEEIIHIDKKNDSFIIEKLMERFHLVSRQLRQRHDDRDSLDIKDEYDVQDLFQALLRIFYDDIRTEEWNPSYAGGSTRSDFLLKNENIVIEIKKTRSSLKAKELGEQLIIDIAKYKTHPNCKILYCFVYDPDGYIRNPKGIENDLNNEKDTTMKVKVVIIPKGH